MAASSSDPVRLAARGHPWARGAGGGGRARPGPPARGSGGRRLRPWRPGGLGAGARCHHFPTEGALARPRARPLRADKGPATLVPPGGADPSCRQPGSGRLSPGSSSEVPLAVQASSCLEWPLARGFEPPSRARSDPRPVARAVVGASLPVHLFLGPFSRRDSFRLPHGHLL